MRNQGAPLEPSDGPQCEFCGYPVDVAVVSDGSGPGERFCSKPCRDAASDGETPFAGQHGYKYVESGVQALDRVLPQGMRSDSLILLRGDAGTHRRELQYEIAWRAIQRGEPAVVVTYIDSPTAVVEQFLTLGWNVLPALDRGLLHVADCFTRRLSDADKFDASKNRWNEHLTRALDGATTTIRNPDDLREVENRLLGIVSELEMTNTGIVVVDSLQEIGTLVSDPQVENFLKEVRADVCQNRYVPLIVGQCSGLATQPLQQQMRVAGGGLSTDITYFVDGIIDLRLNTRVVPNTRLKQLSVRQMNGVRFAPQWITFELGSAGHVPVDSQTQPGFVYSSERLDGSQPRPTSTAQSVPPRVTSGTNPRPATPGRPVRPA